MMDRRITGLLLLLFVAAMVMFFVGFGLHLVTGGDADVLGDLFKDNL